VDIFVLVEFFHTVPKIEEFRRITNREHFFPIKLAETPNDTSLHQTASSEPLSMMIGGVVWSVASGRKNIDGESCKNRTCKIWAERFLLGNLNEARHVRMCCQRNQQCKVSWRSEKSLNFTNGRISHVPIGKRSHS
jgi:hypothetical protein